MARLLLVRPGETAWTRDGLIQGEINIPLTDEGREGVAAVAKELAAEEFGEVCCTPSEFSVETAEMMAAAKGVKVVVDEGLGEPSYGLWQGMTENDVKRRHKRAFSEWRERPLEIRPPDGETMFEAYERVTACAEEIAARCRKGAALLVVGPVAGALIKCYAEGLDPSNVWKLAARDVAWEKVEL